MPDYAQDAARSAYELAVPEAARPLLKATTPAAGGEPEIRIAREKSIVPIERSERRTEDVKARRD